jgi:hypothetical protein
LKPLPKDAGGNTIADLDKLRHGNGGVPTAELRLKMQKVISDQL